MLPVAVLAKVNWLCPIASWRSKHACAACFAYEALAGKPLLRVSYDLEDYNGKLASLHMAPMAGAPVSLRNALQAMLAQSASLRPPAISFTAAGYFQVWPSLADQSRTAHALCDIMDMALSRKMHAMGCMYGPRGMHCGLPHTCLPDSLQYLCRADHHEQHLLHCSGACACRRTCC